MSLADLGAFAMFRENLKSARLLTPGSATVCVKVCAHRTLASAIDAWNWNWSGRYF